jgi:T-complex protein 1 subunit gamma
MAKSLNGVIQWPYKAIASALEVIPRTLAQNCGANTIRALTALRAKHALESEKNVNWGINGETGELADMSQLGIWEPLSVKLQVYNRLPVPCHYFRVAYRLIWTQIDLFDP